jgi:hypothetical protein
MLFNSLFTRQSLSAYALLAVTLLTLTSLSTVFAADISDINSEIDKCTQAHGYDPKQESQLGENELGKNERVFLECVYTGISEALIPKVMVPNDYEKLISSHKQMTNAVEKGEITRKERKTRVIEILTQIKANEAAETERRIQDLSAKRDQFLRQRERMLKRNPRMF